MKGDFRRGLELLPNLLGLMRIAAAPVVAWCILEQALELAFWVFLIAGASDALDGAIARRLDAVTAFGTLLDPVADKLLMNAGYLSAAASGIMPWWLAAVVFSRDAAFALAAAMTRLFYAEVALLPLAIGKLNTGLQVSYGSFALAVAAFGWEPGRVEQPLAVAVAAFTLLSGFGYGAVWLRRIRAAR